VSIFNLILLVVVVVAVVMVVVSRRNRGSIVAQRSELRRQNEVAAQAAAIQQWQAAYTLANPGQPIPAPPLVLGSSGYGASNRTNVMAILAIIFGIFVSILGIVFGHIALSQIRRSGEGGRGLAITGLIFGYVGIVAAIVLLVVELR
jgi:hypothetical protein